MEMRRARIERVCVLQGGRRCWYRRSPNRSQAESEMVPMTPERVTRMFQRVLSAWAVDALRLRRAGLDRPAARHLILRGRSATTPRQPPPSAGLAQFPPPGAQEQAA